ncbi:MAG: sigma-70 family RNA polymerase sigma factor [Myxococcales bacterium]|nr:sigma-70 family RNA polymerase sigma factor [Myxococcales bacterium]MCB9670577.1 sigma-70 family RNA polymerase sigma factor [Alphaproteobacteria bacterium]MCB9691930.1 sigma-70 family RNA polymerase sigma factor [Alphaproteobacteria bacterium]
MNTHEDWRERLRADFGEVFARHRDRVLAVCLRIVGDRARAEELTQDAFVTALGKLDSYEGSANIGTWICGIGKHLALNDIRRSRELLVEDGVVDPAEPGLDALSHLGRHEREELLRQAASDTLEPTEQEVVYLRYVELLPRDRIADILELGDHDAVRVILQRSRRRLERGLRSRLDQLGHGTSFVRTGW